MSKSCSKGSSLRGILSTCEREGTGGQVPVLLLVPPFASSCLFSQGRLTAGRGSKWGVQHEEEANGEFVGLRGGGWGVAKRHTGMQIRVPVAEGTVGSSVSNVISTQDGTVISPEVGPRLESYFFHL